MIREVTNWRVEEIYTQRKTGFFSSETVHTGMRLFVRKKWSFTFSLNNWAKLIRYQNDEPVHISGIDPEAQNKRYWYYRDKVYWENDGLGTESIQVLLDERLNKQRRIIERLKGDKTISTQRRRSIPDDVKTFVWKRDDGVCINCGSNENLEYDHIIPVSKGGSSTARNIQLLCEECNRSKGGELY